VGGENGEKKRSYPLTHTSLPIPPNPYPLTHTS
jgi:hypothetical protein